jgi:pimeloyl-ACP methyl ester carboxylesterase
MGTRILSLPIVAAGAWIVYSTFVIDHALPLPEAIDAQRDCFNSNDAGRLSYYADRSAGGRPIVLIHSINASGSAYEFRPLFEHYRCRRPVYALDLPGFGFSDRSARRYSPELYQSAIVDFLSSQVGGPADVVALTLSVEFVARAALERPDLVHSIAMISPTGFGEPGTGGGGTSSQQVSRNCAGDALYPVISFPLWGRALYDLIATRRSIRFFLQQCFVGAVDAGLLEYGYATSHQPGAHHAPLYFISGELFTPDVRQSVYERLKQPALVIYDRDPFARFDALPAMLQKHLNWRAARITPTLGLPQFERLPDTARELDVFWSAFD